MNRRILFLCGAFLSAVLFFSFGMMILQQKGLAQQEKQRYYSQRALSVVNTLTKRLSVVLDQAGAYTNNIAMGEIFSSQNLSLLNFPEDFRSSVKRIRITDGSGLVLFSSAGTLDNGARLSPEALSLVIGAVNKFVVFTPDQDTFVAATRYDNPTTLQEGTQGYMLFEFTASSIMEGLQGLTPMVRVEKGIPLLVLDSTPDTPFRNIASFDLSRPTRSGPLTGLHLSMPHLGNVVFYMGSGFYFPPFLGIMTFIFCLIMVAMLYLYTKSQETQNTIPENKAKEMKSLISDINKGNTYSQQKAFSAVDSGSRFGNLPADNWDSEMQASPSTNDTSETPAFSFGLLDEDPVFKDEPIEWDDTAIDDVSFQDASSTDETSQIETDQPLSEDINFDPFLEGDEEKDLGVDEAVGELLANEEDSSEAGELPEEGDFASFLEGDEEKDLGVDEAVGELLADEEDSSEAGELPEEGDFASFLEGDEEKDLGVDEAVGELLADEEETADDPISIGEASVDELAALLENTNEDELPLSEDMVEGSLELYNDHLDQLAEQYEISRRATAENREGLFLIDDSSIFGSSFQIAVEDPIFREILSKGRVLSLDGDLEESDYIAGLIAPDILTTLSDLFIVPIINREQRVSHVVVLGRNKGSAPLSVEDHQNLFSYQ
ncbi:MAG: hypothetical protein ACRCY4_02610 [Brevinema sp.]